MDLNAKAKFILALHKHSLHAFDSGGGVVGGGGAGGVLSDISGAMTTQDTYNAAAPTSATTVGAQQAALANQLQNEAAGNGPNPAQLQYLQNAQKIAQAQATNYAQNRALNPALAARMAGNTAANVGQQAAGGAAAQQAQQQLAAQQEMEGLTGQEQQGVMYAQGLNAQTAQANANAVNQTEGGLLNGAGAALVALAKGGMVRKMADGGAISVPQMPVYAAPNVPSFGAPMPAAAPASSSSTPPVSTQLGSQVGKWLKSGATSLFKEGGSVAAPTPAQKAVKKDDSVKNDKIPALLSEGEIVIPRHITEHPQAAKKAAAFVQAVLAKRKVGKKA